MPDLNENDFGVKSWVPQLFYDIIARLVPGAVIIGLLALAVAGPEKSEGFVEECLNKPANDYPSISVIIVCGFVLSYTVAIILLGLCYLTLPFAQRFIMSPNNSNDDFSEKYDFIKRHDPAAGSRITKLKAEMHMAGILIFGLSLSVAINLWKMVASFNTSRVFLMIVLLLAIAGSAGAFRHFVDRQKHAVRNYANLLGYEEWKSKRKQSPGNDTPPNNALNPTPR